MIGTNSSGGATTLPATHAILVLGMHRGGTSAMAGLLHLLGFELGGSLMPAAEGINGKGFWEHLDVFDIHERLLLALGRSRFDPREMPKGWLEHPAFHSAVDEVRRLIERDFQNSLRWAVKDPRMCRLVPVWLQALASLNIQPKIIIVARHPFEVARSMREQRWIASTARSHMCWLQHTLEAERFTRGLIRSLVTYDSLLADWRSQIARVGTELCIDWDTSMAQRAEQIDAFLDPHERHQIEPNRTLADADEEMPSLTMALFDACCDKENAWPRIADIDDIYRRGATSFAPCLDEAIVEASLARLEIGLGKAEETLQLGLCDAVALYDLHNGESYSPQTPSGLQPDLRPGHANLLFELPLSTPLDSLYINLSQSGAFRIAKLQIGETSILDLAERAKGSERVSMPLSPPDTVYVVSMDTGCRLEIDLRGACVVDAQLATSVQVTMEIERLSGVAETTAILSLIVQSQQTNRGREITAQLSNKIDIARAELAAIGRHSEGQAAFQSKMANDIELLIVGLETVSAQQREHVLSTDRALENIVAKLDQLITSDAERFRLRKLFR